eukprot:4011630-Pyramimonas_sp.AAC.1
MCPGGYCPASCGWAPRGTLYLEPNAESSEGEVRDPRSTSKPKRGPEMNPERALFHDVGPGVVGR